jgi:hypothetical protein
VVSLEWERKSTTKFDWTGCIPLPPGWLSDVDSTAKVGLGFTIFSGGQKTKGDTVLLGLDGYNKKLPGESPRQAVSVNGEHEYMLTLPG